MGNKRTLVIYHTSSGNTKKVAEAIADALSADIEQLQLVKEFHVDIKGKGLSNFVNIGKAATGARRKRVVEIHDIQHNLADYKRVIIGTPVYAAHLPAPVRAFCDRYATQLPEVAFFCTGESPVNKLVFELLETACGKTPTTTYPFHAPKVRKNTFHPDVTTFIEQF